MGPLSFEDMYNLIRDYQKKMGYDAEKMSPEVRMQMFRNYMVALMMEQAEMADEVSWKPWRTYSSQRPNPNKRKIALEWVDCLFFLVDQGLMLGLTADDIIKAWDVKLQANHDRIASGYSKTNDNMQ